MTVVRQGIDRWTLQNSEKDLLDFVRIVYTTEYFKYPFKRNPVCQTISFTKMWFDPNILGSKNNLCEMWSNPTILEHKEIKVYLVKPSFYKSKGMVRHQK